MKIVVEPERFKKFLGAGLMSKTGTLIDTITAKFNEGGVLIKDAGLQIAAVYGVFSKEYFLEYKSEEENVPLTATLLEQLNKGFKSEKISVVTEDGNIKIKGGQEKYEEPLLNAEEGKFPVEMKSEEIGLVPVNLKKPNAVVLLEKGSLDLQTAEQYLFESNGKDITVTIEGVGKYTKSIKPRKSTAFDELRVKLDGEYFSHIANNLSEDVWVSIMENAIVFSEKTKDYQLTYLLATIEE
ncbi:hypothetical protein KJ925_05155 [Patescibacteria group bacterium]|nr:hypothetical protein [Patescibacteria group bacterium]